MAALFLISHPFFAVFLFKFWFYIFFCVRIDKTKCHITKDSSMWLNVSILVMSSLNCFSVISGGISGLHVSPSFFADSFNMLNKIKKRTFFLKLFFVDFIGHISHKKRMTGKPSSQFVDNSRFALVTRLRTGIQTRVRS